MHGYLIGKKSVLTLWHLNGLLIFKCISKFANLSKYLFLPVNLQLPPVQSGPITTKVVSSNPVHGEVYSI
jgi:hypothetical protein